MASQDGGRWARMVRAPWLGWAGGRLSIPNTKLAGEKFGEEGIAKSLKRCRLLEVLDAPGEERVYILLERPQSLFGWNNCG